MKVVQELVAYFDRRGRLTKKQIRHLLDQGLLAADAPLTMIDLCDPVGATYYFRVTGEAAGPLWGTDVYTDDSSICQAAVHAGAIPRSGGPVRVQAAPRQESYAGSERNGVTSQDYGAWEGSFGFAK